MRKNALPVLGGLAVAALFATPALAGFNGPTPEPEVAGSLIALAAMGLGFRFLKGRAKR